MIVLAALACLAVTGGIVLLGCGLPRRDRDPGPPRRA